MNTNPRINQEYLVPVIVILAMVVGLAIYSISNGVVNGWDVFFGALLLGVLWRFDRNYMNNRTKDEELDG